MTRRLLLVLAACLTASTTSAAQLRSFPRTHRDSVLRDWPMAVTGSFLQVRPTGEFADNIGFGYGGVATASAGVTSHGILRIRATFGGTAYGRESKLVTISPTVGGRITTRLVTSNALYLGSIGPELAVPSGPIRPYVNAGFGFLYFTTNSHLEGLDDDEDVFTTNNFHDATSTKTGGAGIRFVLGHYEEFPVAIEIGLTHFFGGRARYLKPGSIQDRPDGSIVIAPNESAIQFNAIHLGLSIGR